MSANTNQDFHGGKLVGRVLEEQGIDFLFSLCGGHISPILIGAEEHGVQIIDTRNEANAVFAADAVSRLSGTPGVVAVTAGPGVTNSITALKNAQMAESALVIIAGAAATMLEGRGALQDIDQISQIKETTKWHTSIRKVKNIVPKLEEAFKQSQSGTPGPVFVEMPVDILYHEEIVRDWYGKKGGGGKGIIGKIFSWWIQRHVNKLFSGEYKDMMPEKQLPSYNIASEPTVDEIADLVNNAQKPMLLISSQTMIRKNTVEKLPSAVENLGIPVYLSGMARGLLGKATESKVQLRHKRTKALRTADLILLFGVPLDFRLDYGRKLNREATAVSINLDKETLKMNRTIRNIEHKIHADPADFLLRLEQKVQTSADQWKSWMDTLTERNNDRNKEIKDTAAQDTEFVNPLELCFAIEEIMDDDSVIVADGGDFVATASYIVQPRGPLRWLDPGPFGTLGVGGGFAMGAKAVNPDSEIWLLYGDGAAGFSIAEFDTMARHNLPVIAVVGNDASWQQIAREQVEIFDTPLGTELAYTDYDRVVEGFGGKGLSINDPNEIKDTLQEAKDLVKEGHPVLVNVKIGKTDFRKGSISM